MFSIKIKTPRRHWAEPLIDAALRAAMNYNCGHFGHSQAHDPERCPKCEVLRRRAQDARTCLISALIRGNHE